jgi:glucose/arabinose dehydrogenase
MKRVFLFLGVVGMSMIPLRASFAAVSVPAGFQIQTVASGFSIPTSMVFAPDGRIFVGQKNGVVRVIKNGQVLATPVITLTDVNDYGDRGLEGIALDPNFAQNGYMYIAYTYENTPGQNYDGNKTGRIVRVTVVGDTASLATKIVILGSVGGDAARPSCRNFATTSDCIPSDSNTHSMGALRFGPDGKLYAALGDGAGYITVDPLALDAQDLNSLGGKIVRINTDGTAPADNPFYDGNPNSNRSKVWSLGHRNTFRFSFRPGDNKLFFGDVGWATWEEVDVGARGANYGWPCREGFIATSYNCTPSSKATDPIYVFDHSSGTGSVIGGVIAPASTYPTYAGNYIFGDYSNNVIKRMVLTSSDTSASVENFTSSDAGGPADFVLGPDNLIYYVALNAGEIRKIVYTSANRPPVAVISAAPQAGPAPLTVHFSGSQSSDPDGNPITYRWQFGDGQSSTAAVVDHTYTTNGTYTAALTVTDSLNASASASATISVGQTTGDANPHHVSTTVAPSPVVVGRQETITTTVRNDGAANPFIVDMEIYDSANKQVAQQVYDAQTIATGASANYTLSWLPPTIGNYVVKIGLFKAGWAGLYEWTEAALAITVQNRAPTSTPAFTQTTTLSSPTPAQGSAETITTSVTNTGGAGNALVDIEVYRDGAKVGQQFFDNQSFAAGETKQFTYAYPVSAPGTYTVSVGVFQPGWAGLYVWFDGVKTFSAAASSVSIYQNALATGWENWSWNSTQNFSDTSLVAPGSTKALSTTYTGAWGGLYLHTAGVGTGGLRSLTFSVAGKNAGGQQIQVQLYDANDQPLPAKNINSYIAGGISANSFKQVSIPLTDLGASDRTIHGVVWQDVSGSAGATINLDAVSLTP